MRMDHVNYVETNDNILLNKEGELFLNIFILIKNIEEKLISSSLILKTNIFEEKEKIKKILKKFEKLWIKFKKENLINFKEGENKLEIYKILMHKLMNVNLMVERVPFSFEKIEFNENCFENQDDR
uniref:Uncharacterized protein n=1 Tax=Meloidogyne enterolobii TaxID=390850 RepID=A0A6V7X388_MELEN|nr:unnamed protein product [Meloidogyne enterolobii]